MVLVPLFWNAKSKKAQDIQQQPAGRKPRVSPKQIVPKPESYIFTALGDLVKTFQLTAVGLPVWHDSSSIRIPVKRVQEIQLDVVICRSALTGISGSQVSMAEHMISGSDFELFELVLRGRLSKTTRGYAKGKPILTAQEMLDILTALDDLD